MGHTHGARPPGIVGAITGEGNVNGKDVGKISIFGNFSLVEIRGGLTGEQLSAIGSARVGGRELRIAEDTGPRRPSGDRPFRRDGERPFRRDNDRGFKRDGDHGFKRDGAKPWRREGGGSRFDSKRRAGSNRRHEDHDG